MADKLKWIKKVIMEDGYVSLLVHCPRHNGDTIIEESCWWCNQCGHEIADISVNAWGEFKEKHPPVDINL